MTGCPPRSLRCSGPHGRATQINHAASAIAAGGAGGAPHSQELRHRIVREKPLRKLLVPLLREQRAIRKHRRPRRPCEPRSNTATQRAAQRRSHRGQRAGQHGVQKNWEIWVTSSRISPVTWHASRCTGSRGGARLALIRGAPCVHVDGAVLHDSPACRGRSALSSCVSDGVLHVTWRVDMIADGPHTRAQLISPGSATMPW